MDTKLTVPIAARNLEEAAGQMKAAEAGGAEMLELRVDYMEELSVDLAKKLIGQTKSNAKQLPIIVTCRDERQGGAKSYADQLRVDVLSSAIESSAEFIDLEYENYLSAENREKIDSALSKGSKTRLILSEHNFKTKFADIEQLYDDILQTRPTAIVKLVYTAEHINDCFDGFDLLHKKSSGERIVFCMGEAGLISRIIAKKLGSFVTFASINDESATAPGQLTIGELRNLYRYDSINSDTELFGVIASPVVHSLSPAVHNACFAEVGANKLYLPLLVEGGKKGFDEFMRNVLDRRWLGFRGFSVTIPHKAHALDYVSGAGEFIEPLAVNIGAVNTLKVGLNGRVSGYNTDYAGAMNALVSALGINKHELHNTTVAVIGAGGVGRAVVAGLADVGAKITIYNRTVEKAQALAEEFNCKSAGLDALDQLDARVVINCTSIGMHPNVDATPLPKEHITNDMMVFDTVYNPAETLLLKQAKQAGARTIDGITMFVNQALAQFKIFTGQDGNAEIMHKIVAEKPGQG